tara:strand:- start:1671 stop:2630 length:960 start_codon:yes stop_codon:yes gene_type:complete
MKDTKDKFDNIIGQDSAKKKLEFFINGYDASGIIPHLMFVAPKGSGKTMLAKQLGRNLTARHDEDRLGRPKKFLEINCSTLKSVKQFFNQIVIPHIHEKECTILFDEASELPKDVTMALLTVLNPNSENRTSFSYEDYTVDFDFSRQSFMFATTEAQSIFHALMDRTERIDLEEYSYNQLGQIVARVCVGKTFEDGVLDRVATVLRGNARAAQKMANNIVIFLKSKKKKNFTNKHWIELSNQLGILPLGLNPIEVQVLRHLSEKKDCSLTHLSAKTGLSKACLQRDFEMYLQKMNLMEITTAGRAITSKGQKYLEELAG